MSTGSTSPVSDEKILSVYLHSELLGTLFLGMYTPLYFGTMYIYITGKSSNNRIVLAATTMLYVVSATGSVVEWLKIPILIGINGESTSDSLSAESMAVSTGANAVLIQLLGTLPFIVADGLLVWRCFKIWNNSRRVIALPVILLFAETALYITNSVYIKFVSSDAEVLIANRMLSAALFITLAVTLWTTVLIGYRIYSTSTLILNQNKLRFYNILEIIIQSSSIYALALVPCALLPQIPQKQSTVYSLTTAQFYLNSFLAGMTGIAPTIMVARIALASNSGSDAEPTTVGVSGIQFGEQNPNINTQEVVSHNGVLQEQANST